MSDLSEIFTQVLHTYRFILSIKKQNWKIRQFWVADPLNTRMEKSSFWKRSKLNFDFCRSVYCFFNIGPTGVNMFFFSMKVEIEFYFISPTSCRVAMFSFFSLFFLMPQLPSHNFSASQVTTYAVYSLLISCQQNLIATLIFFHKNMLFWVFMLLCIVTIFFSLFWVVSKLICLLSHAIHKHSFRSQYTISGNCMHFYASSTSGDAYRDRRLTTNFELWVEIFCVPTCFHVRIQKPCLSVCPSVCPHPEKRYHQSFVNISPTFVIDTSMERFSRVLHHGNPKI